MSLKYCFNHEIHKTFQHPPDYASLIKEITSLFLQKLPARYLLQYQDADGDRIAISTNQEYQALLSYEVQEGNCMKIFIMPLESKEDQNSPRSHTNGSFEVVDEEHAKSQEIIELDSDDSVSEKSEKQQNKEDKEEEEEGKIVVSLQIPEVNNGQQKPNEEEDVQEKSITSVEHEDKPSVLCESRDVVEDLSLSLEEGDSDVSKTVYNRGFQTEDEEGLNNSKRSIQQQNSRKRLNFVLRNLVDLTKKSVQVQDLDQDTTPDESEKEVKDLREYLQRQKKKSVCQLNQSSIELALMLAPTDTQQNLPNNNKEESPKDQSQEHWVSFSSEHEEGFVHAAMARHAGEVPNKSLFSLKQRVDPWVFTNQEKEESRRYQERENKKEELMESSSNSMSPAGWRGRRKNQIRNDSNGNGIDILKDLLGMRSIVAGLKDEEVEERKGKYKDLGVLKSDEEKVMENCLKGPENAPQEMIEKENWYDPQYPQYYFQENVQAYVEQYKRRKSIDFFDSFKDQGRQEQAQEQNKDEVFKDISDSMYEDFKPNHQPCPNPAPENLENLNVSLFTASEANQIASAIGSINKIKEVRKLVISSREPSPEKVRPCLQQISPLPLYNRWVQQESEQEVQNKDEWTFSNNEEDDNLKKKDEWYTDEKRAHAGTFCMKCWMSPIYGPIYVCLVCDDIEYCEKCEPFSGHCHPLLRIKEPNEGPAVLKEEDIFGENNNVKEIEMELDEDPLGQSLEKSLDLWTYQPLEESPGKYKFEYKEISSTPLSIRSNRKEWCLIYKTVCLKNVGQAVWSRCHLEPIGQVPGTMTEVSYVLPGNSVLITLEIHGFFTPGRYTSKWRVVHQGEMDLITEMGHMELDFEILENKGPAYLGDFDYDYEKKRFKDEMKLDEELGDWKF